MRDKARHGSERVQRTLRNRSLRIGIGLAVLFAFGLMASGAFTEEDGKETLAEIRKELDEAQSVISALAREEELLHRQESQLVHVEQRLQEWRGKLTGSVSWADRRQAVEDFIDWLVRSKSFVRMTQVEKLQCTLK